MEKDNRSKDRYPYKSWRKFNIVADQPYAWSKHVTLIDLEQGRRVIDQKPLSFVYTDNGWYEETTPS